MFLSRISIGRLFDSHGPAAVKLQSPIYDCVRGMAHTHVDVRRPERLTSYFCDELAIIR